MCAHGKWALRWVRKRKEHKTTATNARRHSESQTASVRTSKTALVKSSSSVMAVRPVRLSLDSVARSPMKLAHWAYLRRGKPAASCERTHTVRGGGAVRIQETRTARCP